MTPVDEDDVDDNSICEWEIDLLVGMSSVIAVKNTLPSVMFFKAPEEVFDSSVECVVLLTAVLADAFVAL